MNLNFIVALLIADEATKRLGVKHEVQANLTGGTPATSWLEGNSVVHSNGISVTLDAGYNWDDSSVRIVRVGDGWGAEVLRAGWQLCADAFERFSQPGQEPVALIGGYRRTWDGLNWLAENGSVVARNSYHTYTVQWRISEYEDVTAEIIEWWAKYVKEGLK